MNGFTIKCNKCGAETVVTLDITSTICRFLEYNNEFVEVGSAGYDGAVGIYCNKCGNKIEEQC